VKSVDIIPVHKITGLMGPDCRTKSEGSDSDNDNQIVE